MENKDSKNRQLEERNDRIRKIELIKELGLSPYADKFERSHSLNEARESNLGTEVTVAGRIVLSRDMGKLGFCQIQDHTGKLQLVLKVDEL
jgi:lysyl-tRNA synthetase class 2